MALLSRKRSTVLLHNIYNFSLLLAFVVRVRGSNKNVPHTAVAFSTWQKSHTFYTSGYLTVLINVQQIITEQDFVIWACLIWCLPLHSHAYNIVLSLSLTTPLFWPSNIFTSLLALAPPYPFRGVVATTYFDRYCPSPSPVASLLARIKRHEDKSHIVHTQLRSQGVWWSITFLLYVH